MHSFPVNYEQRHPHSHFVFRTYHHLSFIFFLFLWLYAFSRYGDEDKDCDNDDDDDSDNVVTDHTYNVDVIQSFKVWYESSELNTIVSASADTGHIGRRHAAMSFFVQGLQWNPQILFIRLGILFKKRLPKKLSKWCRGSTFLHVLCRQKRWLSYKLWCILH